MATSSPQQIVIAGGGFAGVRAARKLAGQSGVQVKLITENPDFTYYPQLYHAATGGARSESALPLAQLLSGTGVELITATVTKVDAAGQTLTTADGSSYPYDKLILALGSVTNYFGIKGLEEFAFSIKSIAGAEAFKKHLHQQLIEEQRPDVNYVVVGGGPTGVELAAALGEYLHRIVRLHGIAHPTYTIELVEAAPRLVPRSSEKQSAKIQQRLEKLGVKVMTGVTVEAETATELQLHGEKLATKTVIWTAGVANNPFFAANAAQFELAKNGRVVVNEFLEAKPNLYVIGDNAVVQFGGLAQTAVDNANFVAADITRQLQGRTRAAYKPHPSTSVIPVGSGWAAVQATHYELFGYGGWLLRRAADLIAYSDIERWPQAIRVWLSDLRREDDCPVCAGELQASSASRNSTE